MNKKWINNKYKIRTFKRSKNKYINIHNRKIYGITITNNNKIIISKLKRFNYIDINNEYQNIIFSRGNQKMGSGKSNPIKISLINPKYSIFSYINKKNINTKSLINIKKREIYNKIIIYYTYKWMKNFNIKIKYFK